MNVKKLQPIVLGMIVFCIILGAVSIYLNNKIEFSWTTIVRVSDRSVMGGPLERVDTCSGLKINGLIFLTLSCVKGFIGL